MPQIRTPPCSVCGETTVLDVSDKQHRQMVDGTKHIQDIFPDWPASDREMLITGTHPQCWDEIFGEEKD